MSKQHITIKQAIQLTGKSDSTLRRLVKKHTRMTKRDQSGKLLIDKAFLLNHYQVTIQKKVTKQATIQTPKRVTKQVTKQVTPEFLENVRHLIESNKLLRQSQKHLKEQVQDLKQDKQFLQNQTKLLAIQKSQLIEQNNELTHQLTAANKKHLQLPEKD